MRLDCYVGILVELETKHYLMEGKIENVVATTIECWNYQKLELNFVI